MPFPRRLDAWAKPTSRARVGLGVVELSFGRLSLADASMFYDEPFIVDLPVTRCAIEAQLTDLEGSLFVSSIRIGGGELATASLLGSFDVPFGQLGICDREAMEAAFSALPEERMVEYFDQLSFTELRGAASVANETMWIVRPGFGASTCNAYDLRGADGSRGVLIDCVAAIDFT